MCILENFYDRYVSAFKSSRCELYYLRSSTTTRVKQECAYASAKRCIGEVIQRVIK